MPKPAGRHNPEWVEAWKPFLQGIRPIHHWATCTFSSFMPREKAVRIFIKAFLLPLSRIQKQHLFVYYVYDVQKLRSDRETESTYHIHFLISYETKPIDKKEVAQWWADCDSSTGKFEIADYKESAEGIFYAFGGHSNYELEVICPRHRHRCKKSSFCPYQRNAALWRIS